MLQATMTHACRVCKSPQIVKNGSTRCGNAQYHCKDCGTYRVLTPNQAYSENEQPTMLRACLERCSLHGVARIFAMARQSVARWLKAHIQTFPDVKVKETLLPAAADDVLELEEIWSCVQKKEQKQVVYCSVKFGPLTYKLTTSSYRSFYSCPGEGRTLSN